MEHGQQEHGQCLDSLETGQGILNDSVLQDRRRFEAARKWDRRRLDGLEAKQIKDKKEMESKYKSLKNMIVLQLSNTRDVPRSNVTSNTNYNEIVSSPVLALLRILHGWSNILGSGLRVRVQMYCDDSFQDW